GAPEAELPPPPARGGAPAEWRLADKMLAGAGVFLLYFIVALDSSATLTIRPRVLSDFNAMTQMGTVSTVMYLLVAGVRPVFSQISDAFGRAHALALSAALYGTGALVCALAQSFATVFGGTVVSGFGVAGCSTLAAIVVADILPLHQRGIAAAYVSVPSITNYYLGVVLGGRLLDRWHWVYGILCVLGLVCVLSAALVLWWLGRHAPRQRADTSEEPHQEKAPVLRRLGRVLLELDIPGLALLSGGLIAILAPLGLQLGKARGWASAPVIAPVVAGAAVLAGFVYYESKVARRPAVPLRLLRARTMACAMAAGTLFFYTFNVTLMYFSPYLQVSRGFSAQTAMMLQQSQTGYQAGLLAGGWAMQWSRRYRRWAWAGWAMALAAVGLMFRAASVGGVPAAEVALVQVLFGIGGGMVVGCIGIGVQAAVEAADLSIAITLFSMVEYIGGVLGEGTAATLWANMLPARLEGRLALGVDLTSTVNNITYYRALPGDQRAIVQGAYAYTQRTVTICGICALGLAAAAMLGLAPLSLEPAAPAAAADAETNDASDTATGSAYITRELQASSY
ncbi:hypothetical protein H4R18_004184, partial [Coemansia javaensis]